jgi:hypothetical protein
MMMRRRLFGVQEQAVGGPDRQRGVKDGHPDSQWNEPAVHGW